MSSTTPTSETIAFSMVAVPTLPPDLEPLVVGEKACQAAFAAIAETLGDAGYPVTGDFAPEEHMQMVNVFALFVRAMATNNPTLADVARWAIGDLDPDEDIDIVVDAMEPGAIPLDAGVAVQRIGPSSMGDAVRLRGTRVDVARLLLDGWGDDPEWVRATVAPAPSAA